MVSANFIFATSNICYPKIFVLHLVSCNYCIKKKFLNIFNICYIHIRICQCCIYIFFPGMFQPRNQCFFSLSKVHQRPDLEIKSTGCQVGNGYDKTGRHSTNKILGGIFILKTANFVARFIKNELFLAFMPVFQNLKDTYPKI